MDRSQQSLLQAQLLFSGTEGAAFESAARSLHLSLDAFLLSGFGALLIRLTRQDSLSIVHAGPTATVVTLSAEGRCSFASMARNTESTGLQQHVDSVSEAESLGATTRALGIPGTASYRFLDDERGLAPRDEYGLQLTIQRERAGLKAELTAPLASGNADGLALWLGYLRTLLNAAAAGLELPVKHLPLLDECSTLAFYSELNRTGADFPREECVHDLFARQASLTPNAIAVISGGRRLSYRELEERSTRLASILIGMGAGPGRPVAICMERSVDLPMALLAVLKAGAFYVPLDPRHPRERLMTVLEECLPVAVVSNQAVASVLRLQAMPTICVDQPWPEAACRPGSRAARPEDLAYAIYTSGTTGRPKGVMLGHRSLTNLIWAMRREPGFSSSDRMLGVATISFDIATADMFLPLICGGQLVIASRDEGSDPVRLAALIERHDITVMQLTPVTWRALVDSGWRGKPDLKMISGGDTLPRELANLLLDRGSELWNGYGPTETTIWSGFLRVEDKQGTVRLGPPMANTRYYVMDEAGRPLPEGVAGELYIGGLCVGHGYLNRPELTQQRFVEDPFSAEGRLFRSGDLVRIVNRRELEFFGRLDHQVKLRGYRIELGEIESVLRTHPAVSNAVVVLREDVPGEPRLVAYVIFRDAPVDLRAHAARQLPEYMLPQRIVAMEEMPLTSSGKIDRRLLPLPEAPTSAGAEPETELETKLLKIFRELLGAPLMGVTDNFFDYGGYSLVAVKLFARIKHELQLDLPISVLFDAPAVRVLARLIETGAMPPIIVPIRPQGKRTPLFIIHSYLIYEALPAAIGGDRPVFGLRETNGADEGGALEERVKVYADAIAGIYPEGPLCLAAWCAAGSLTVELGRLLSERGHTVALVALFDSERPGYEDEVLRRTPWKQRLEASWNFHWPRFLGISSRARLAYLGAVARHQWERQVEGFTRRHRHRALWFERHLPFAIPAAILNNAAVSIAFPADYPWQPYPGKIVLFRASEVPQLPHTDVSLGWNAVAIDGVHVEFVPGDHETMFKEPHVKVFGEKLEAALEEIDAAAESGDEADAHASKTA